PRSPPPFTGEGRGGGDRAPAPPRRHQPAPRPHPDLSGPAQRAGRSVDAPAVPRKRIALTPRKRGKESRALPACALKPSPACALKPSPVYGGGVWVGARERNTPPGVRARLLRWVPHASPPPQAGE